MISILFALGPVQWKWITTAWASAIAFLTTTGLHFATNLFAAAVILGVGYYISRMIRGLCTRLLTRAQVDETLIKFLTNIAYALALTFVIIAAISRLGVDTTSLAAIVAAAGLTIGLALQGSLANFASGVLLILFKPFKVGDFVTIGGTSGVVEEVHIFSTFLRTGDNIQIIMPNAQITGATISNFSTKPTRRVDLVIGCGYDDDLKQVKQLLEGIIAADNRILAEPEPVVAVNELGASSVDFVVRPWVNSADYWAVKCDLTEQIKVSFDEQGLSIPYPQQDVHMHTVQ